ncbi:MAG: hypothetical protein JWM33_2529 [Caulobacteraceae bacterium]|nr:hypothetical protein [Caulobacteraceae bacterium]
MTQRNLDDLLAAGPDRSLDGLEEAVWARLDAERRSERGLSGLISVQLALLVGVVIASAAVGGMVGGRALAEPPSLGVFSPHSALTPSGRLVGSGQ